VIARTEWRLEIGAFKSAFVRFHRTTARQLIEAARILITWVITPAWNTR
jgi:hypothetical protein